MAFAGRSWTYPKQLMDIVYDVKTGGWLEGPRGVKVVAEVGAADLLSFERPAMTHSMPCSGDQQIQVLDELCDDLAMPIAGQ